jgi:hypothetical protein
MARRNFMATRQDAGSQLVEIKPGDGDVRLRLDGLILD